MMDKEKPRKAAIPSGVEFGNCEEAMSKETWQF